MRHALSMHLLPFHSALYFSSATLRMTLAVALSLVVRPLFACGLPPEFAHDRLQSLASAAINPDSARAADAIRQLRASGQPGLDALLATHASTIAMMRSGTVRLEDPAAARIRAACDAVAKQRDAFASGLFWHTSLQDAEAAARTSGRPILSLRLLGNLDEELSCANSRFFRTTLYANGAVAQLLRERFVLHWQSVRPVPRMSVDFGDGRRIERTVTGNSIHYILDADGAVIDALPGLRGAESFASSLRAALEIAQKGRGLSAADRTQLYADAHRLALTTLEARWNADLAKLGIDALTFSVVHNGFSDVCDSSGASASPSQTDEVWRKIAELHRSETRLDPSSRALLRAKNPTAEEAGVRSLSKHVVESPLLRAMRNLESSIALDSVRNEFLMHARIHQWLVANPDAGRDLEKLNRRVYAELFLTPDTDPWLGMAPADILSALDNDGLVTHSTHRDGP